MSIIGRSPRTIRQIEARIDELERNLARLDHEIRDRDEAGRRESAALRAERARVAERYLWNIQARQAALARTRGQRWPY